MLIGIDASRAVKNQRTGTEHYSQQIILNLALIDKDNDYILYSPIAPSGDLAKLPKNFSWKIMPFPKLWSQIRLSWEMIFASSKPKVVFEPAHTIPIFHHQKTVVTLHDLGFKYFPELYTPLERKYHNWCMDFSVRHAAHIITPSLYTKKDLVKNYGINPKNISVIYHGYNNKIYKPRLYPKPIEDPYIFFVGRLENKKNIRGLIEAYELLRREPKIKHKLVLAGKPGYGYEKYRQFKDNLPPNLQKDIIELGYIEEEELSSWMKNADVFFFPSFFEGFGLPILEAMACAVPVVASKITSIPEVASDCALLVNPRKPFEMAAALSKIINDKNLYKTLANRGKVRANQFSWIKSAQQTLAVLEEIANNNQ